MRRIVASSRRWRSSPSWASGCRPARPPRKVSSTWAVHVSLAPTWFDPAETSGIITPFMVLYALHDAHAEADAGQPDGAEPGRVVERVARRTRLRLRSPQRREVPQRRSGHRRGREVLVRALPRRRRQGAQGARRGGRDAGSRARAHPAQAAVARLHDLLSPAPPAPAGSCPKKYVEKVGDEGFKKAPIGAGPVQVRLVHAGRGAGPRGLRPVLAEGAEREAPGPEGRFPTRRRGWPR